jgi:hypothetical protein
LYFAIKADFMFRFSLYAGISRIISSKHPIGQPPTEGQASSRKRLWILIEVFDGLER